ncbi:MAG: TraR/DksA family transcriptional regulator [Treponema sp.]|nr:TraR/DksA family transcriptional regulator [Treponema sp.]MDE6245092.1 TraR/DksA family transcriptional regulator [Treponemataceae bacterium]MBD5408995.1 TraR/DksA family transcriptional regulator [Treponema sp.]MBD5412347.1 TraR/DksA family transcriptional regulator [Treponema sp.]MBD5442133.1 TraR/DksA family transcriptional regulator [Treponema sp.]
MDEQLIMGVKEKLLEQRERILASLDNQSVDMRNLVKPVESGDEADVASDAIDRTLLDSLGAQDAQLLKQIDGALERIRLNKYGICLGCGKEIPQARLEALPYALLCITCASAEERRRR